MILKIAKESNLIILPTGISLGDLEATIKLAHEFKQKDIDPAKITIALCCGELNQDNSSLFGI